MKALFPDEELLYQVVYQFTHPAKDVYKLIKQGKNKFDEVVIEDIGVTYSPADLLVVVEAVLGHIGMVNSAKCEGDEDCEGCPADEELDKEEGLWE